MTYARELSEIAAALTIDGSKNVGIGTSSPATKLTIKAATNVNMNFNTGNTASNARMIALNDAGNSLVGMELQASTHAFLINASDGLRIDSSGNVGIGTASPNQAMTIQRGAGVDAAITMRGNNVGASSEFYVGHASDGNAYIYNRNNGGIVFGTNNITQASVLSGGAFQFNSGYGSSATAYGCRAWVNFNGTGTVAIRGSGNVSSITDYGTGNYGLSFSSGMPDANFSAIATGSNGDGQTAGAFVNGVNNGTNGFQINTTIGDAAYISVAIFR